MKRRKVKKKRRKLTFESKTAGGEVKTRQLRTHEEGIQHKENESIIFLQLKRHHESDGAQRSHLRVDCT